MTTASVAPVAPEHSPRPTRALIGVVVAFAVVNLLFVWIDPEGPDSVLLAVMYGMFAQEPILFGVWTALGAGSILKRLPVAILLLVLIDIAPGYIPAGYSDIRSDEFALALLMGVAVYIMATLVFLVFRMLTRFRIQLPTGGPQDSVRFSLQELLILITLCAIAMGLGLHLKFNTSPQPFVFGFDFYLHVLTVGGSILSLALLPTTAVLLAFLHGRPSRGAIQSAAALWFVVVLVLILFFVDRDKIFTEFLVPILVMQLSASVVGAAVAIWLRYNGLRLVRPPRLATQPAPSEP